ncbi:MAG TPA: SIMPL domain-containing protein [Vicinamibacterales bacterium]|nr:SIMPL domain-containing protein [Vicinamibacterales bacterium]
MNARRWGLVAVLVLIALSSSAQIALSGRTGEDVISVNGESEVRVVPDEVVLSLGVETFHAALRTAKSMNDERIQKAMAAARSLSVQASQMQTDYVGIEPKYPNGDIARDLQGYVVRRTVVIRLKEISKFEDLLTAALEAGVTHVHGIEFRTTELRKHRDQARVMAIKAAQEKAALLARESGRKVGSARSIGEASYGYHASYGSWWGARYSSMSQNAIQNVGGAPLESDSTLAPGQISIRVSVHASYVLQ